LRANVYVVSKGFHMVLGKLPSWLELAGGAVLLITDAGMGGNPMGSGNGGSHFGVIMVIASHVLNS